MNIRTVIIGCLLAAAASEARAADRQIEQRVAAQANGSVEISNVAGLLQITGSDRAEVEVKGEVDDGVERVDVSSDGARTYIKVIIRRNSHDGEARLAISVPRGSEVAATAVSADIDSKGIQGRQRLTSVSGEIKAEIAGADVQAKSVSGDVVLRGTQQPADLRLSTVSGNLQLERGAGDVDATSTSGDVNLEVSPARSVRLHSTSGDLEFRGQLAQDGSLDAETVSGEVSLKARGKYDYEVRTFAGAIENCFGKVPQRTEPHGPGSRLDGKVGEGGARIRAKSMSGDINVCDK